MIEENNRDLLLQLQMLRLEFFDKYCKSCIGTNLQKERKCAKLRDHDFLSCSKKDNYIKSRISGLEKEIMKKEIMMLTRHHTERSQSPHESRFPLNILD